MKIKNKILKVLKAAHDDFELTQLFSESEWQEIFEYIEGKSHKRGIVARRFKTLIGAIVDAQYEVEELERSKKMSRIKIINLTGTDNINALESLPEWIPTKDIKFL